MSKQSRLDKMSQQRKLVLTIGIPTILLILFFGIRIGTRAILDDYAQSKEFSTYPEADLIRTDDPGCKGVDAVDRCITKIYCTDDSVETVVDYFSDDVDLEPAPDFFGENAYQSIREAATLDDILYFLAGQSDGQFLITMSLGANEFYTDAYGCPDQTVIVSTVAWNEP